MKTKKRAGRPSRELAQGERVPMSFRVPPAVKHRMDEAAAMSGRSVAQEIEIRLERSFREGDLLPQILDAAYGRQTAGLLMLLGRCIRDTSRHAAFAETYTLEGVENWMDQPWAFQQTVEAIDLVLKTLRPDGEPRRQKPTRVSPKFPRR